MAALSKPAPINFTSRNRQLVTRFQERRIRATFHFLSLPPELRNMIYDLCLSFRGVETFFNNYYAKLTNSNRPATIQTPKHPMRTASILLLCRQVYSEAIGLLQKKTVGFNHGLLDIKGIDHVICANALRKIGTIEITTKGHPVLQRNILYVSWVGYMDLLSWLAQILWEGHSLKKLLIDLSDPGLAIHTTTCWYSSNACDFKEQLRESLNELRKIRGVGYVEIKGIDPAFARGLKMRMESKPLCFIGLPGEIRNNIYHMSFLDYTDISAQLLKTMSGWIDHAFPPQYPPRSTPTILLLNKQISKEASEILQSTPLNLVLPYDHNMQKQAEVPNMMKFITPETLVKVQYLNIHIQSWEWMYSLESFLPVLAGNHSLKSFHISFSDNLKGTFLSAQTKKYPDKTLHKSLSGLAKIRGVARVTIDGDLPEVYAQGLAEIMQSPASNPSVPTLRAICGNGAIVDADEEED